MVAGTMAATGVTAAAAVGLGNRRWRQAVLRISRVVSDVVRYVAYVLKAVRIKYGVAGGRYAYG